MESPIRTNDRLISIHFNSIIDMMEYKLPNGRSHPNYSNYQTDMVEGRRRLDLGSTARTPKEIVQHALIGDEQLGKVVRELSSRLVKAEGRQEVDYKQKVPVVKRRRLRSDFGDEIDIHRVYQGQLDKAWARTERVVQDMTHSLITVFIDIGGNWNENTAQSLWRSAAACLLVGDLEKAGKSVKVVVGGASSGSYDWDSRYSTISLVVKDFNQPLSLQRLAAMTHLGFYRSVGFGCKSIFPKALTSGYGQSTAITRSIPIQLQDEIDAGHSRFVHIERANSMNSAKRELDSCYEQMRKYSEEVSHG